MGRVLSQYPRESYYLATKYPGHQIISTGYHPAEIFEEQLEKCGVDYFLTTKMAWNDTNRFPYTSFYWQGIDGTRVDVVTKSGGLLEEVSVEDLMLAETEGQLLHEGETTQMNG